VFDYHPGICAGHEDFFEEAQTLMRVAISKKRRKVGASQGDFPGGFAALAHV
jgi:hypothetical protein